MADTKKQQGTGEHAGASADSEGGNATEHAAQPASTIQAGDDTEAHDTTIQNGNGPIGTQPTSAEDTRLAATQEHGREKLSRTVLVILLVGATALFIPIIRMFIVPLVLASAMTTLFFPYYKWLRARLRGHKALSSLACCATLVLGLLIPTYILGHLVALQAIELYSTIQPRAKEIVRRGEKRGILGKVRRSSIVRTLRLDRIDWQNTVSEGVKAAGRAGTAVINRTSAGLFSVVANAAIMIFTMFYFFMDGEELVRRLRYLSPLPDEYEEMILTRFLLISRATVKGTLLVGLVQGSIGSVTLLVFGIRTWLLWGFVMVLLSIIPVVGAWLVMIPAAIIQVLLGHTFRGIGIFVVSTAVISNIDNLIRPRLVGRDAKMHDLLIFFSTLGGIGVFGIMGFIIGPIIASLFVTILDIYSLEFKSQLNHPGTNRGQFWRA